MGEPSDDSVFRATTFEGKISAGAFEENVTFVARAGRDCRLVVDPLLVSAETYIALSKWMGRPGGRAEPIVLSGESNEGVKFSSQHMEVCGTRFGTHGR